MDHLVGRRLRRGQAPGAGAPSGGGSRTTAVTGPRRPVRDQPGADCARPRAGGSGAAIRPTGRRAAPGSRPGRARLRRGRPGQQPRRHGRTGRHPQVAAVLAVRPPRVEGEDAGPAIRVREVRDGEVESPPCLGDGRATAGGHYPREAEGRRAPPRARDAVAAVSATPRATESMVRGRRSAAGPGGEGRRGIESHKQVVGTTSAAARPSSHQAAMY